MKDIVRVKIADAGRLVIPADLRREYGFAEGEEVLLCPVADGIEIMTPAAALKRAQDRVRSYIPGDEIDLTDELLASRTGDDSLR